MLALAVLGAVRAPTVTADVTPVNCAAAAGCIADIMGTSGTPIPSQGYIAAAFHYYLDGNFANYTPNAVFTPEGLYPITGAQSLPLDTSVQEGLQILNSTILNQTQSGHDVVVYGLSQSADIASLEMDRLAGMTSGAPSADQLSFVLVADEMNPDGGVLERLAGLTLPSLGIDFYGATPDATPYATDIYTAEYDGFADFPRYPIDLLADLNAVLGILFVHGNAGYFNANDPPAILLPGSTDYPGTLPGGIEAAVNTDYYMIPTRTLPLLQPLQLIPAIGKPLYDLLEPDTKILVDLGYGHVDTIGDVTNSLGGWDEGPANIATPVGFFPAHLDLEQLPTVLMQGAELGFHDFVDDVTSEINGVASGGSSGLDIGLPSLTDIVDALSSAASSGYAVLLPTADILTALATSMPVYDVSLFVDELQDAFQGGNMLNDLMNAVGLPIAADFGLVSLTGGLELETLLGAATSIVGDVTSLF